MLSAFLLSKNFEIIQLKSNSVYINTSQYSMETINETCHSKEELVLSKKQGKTHIVVWRLVYKLCMSSVWDFVYGLNNKLLHIFVMFSLKLYIFKAKPKAVILDDHCHWIYLLNWPGISYKWLNILRKTDTLTVILCIYDVLLCHLAQW
jgi:hypothetical protein